MADQTTVERQLLDELTRRAMTLDGVTIRFGIPAPAAVHRGSKAGLTTADILAFVEFGFGRTKKGPTKTRKPRKKISKLRRRGRKLLGKLLSGFRGKPVPRAKKKAKAQKGQRPRPVIRHVAAANRGDMADGFKAASKFALKGKDPKPVVRVLTERLAQLTRQRMVDVGAVDSGQTLEAIDAVSIKARRSSGP